MQTVNRFDGDFLDSGATPFPAAGDNFRTPPRSDLFLALGIMERALDMPERADTDFTLHADHQNYLSGRGRDRKDG